MRMSAKGSFVIWIMPSKCICFALALLLSGFLAVRPSNAQTQLTFADVFEHLRVAERLVADQMRFQTNRTDEVVTGVRLFVGWALIAKTVRFEPDSKLVLVASTEKSAPTVIYIIADKITGDSTRPGTIVWRAPEFPPVAGRSFAEPARDGQDGKSEGESGTDGSSGRPGQKGADGASAPSVVIITKDGITNVAVHLDGQTGQQGGGGQNGGKGGAGRQGVPASQDVFNCRRGPGQGGNGGRGGNAGPGGAGGNGGNGGLITIIGSPVDGVSVRTNQGPRGTPGSKGEVGPGGEGGAPGQPQLPWCQPRNDRAGTRGADGIAPPQPPEAKDGTPGQYLSGTLDPKAAALLFN